MQKTRESGFTLAELLIVVAIIAVLVAISIPVFTSLLEKSRESADAANIRSAYAEVMVAANADDETSSLYADGKWTIAEKPLKQQKDGWQNEATEESLNNLGTLDGSPEAGGTFSVSYDPTTSTLTIQYGDGTGNTPFSISWPSTSSVGAKAKSLLPTGTNSGIIYTTDEGLTTEQQEMVNEIKTKLGITGDVAVYYGWSGSNIKVSIVEGSLAASTFETQGKYTDWTYATRIDYNPQTGEITKVTKEHGKWGNNGGKIGFWGNDVNGKYPMEVLYEK